MRKGVQPNSFQMLEALEDRRLMSTTWGTQETLIGQNTAAANYPTVSGAGTSIVIIDTGVNYNLADLGGGIGPGHKVVYGWDYVDNDADPMDTDANGHGTGVAALAAGLPYVLNGATYQGVAPGANIIALRIDDGTFGWNKEANNAIKALQWVEAHRDEYNIVAVNMSFGRGHYTSVDDIAAQPTDVSALQAQLATLASMGIFMAGSSGNDGLQNGVPGIEFPAIDPNVVAVGGVYPNGTLWSSTERSSDMDLLAPGVGVTLLCRNPTNGQWIHYTGGQGTSFSTAFVSGMAALLKQVDPTLSPDQMTSIMKRSGTPLFDPTTGLSWPILNINNALSTTYLERDDSHENNDTLATATSISFSGNTLSQNGLKLLQGDADFFKFTLSERSDVDYSLSLSGGGTAPTVDLLDAQGTVLKRLSSSDQIRLLAGTYYLRVNGPTATLDGTYGFSITKTPDDGLNNQTPGTAAPIDFDVSGHGSVSGMTLLGGADDYYSITFDATHDVTLTLNYGGTSTAPTVQLLDTNGNFIATVDGSLARRLTAGRYLLRVSSPDTIDATYGLAVAAILYVPPTPPAAPGTNGLSNSIAYDAAGNLHMAYYDSVTNNLKYAKRSAAGVWSSIVTVDASLQVGQYLSLDLDASGRPGIAYYDARNADLKYAHFNGTSWDVTTVDSSHTTGYYPSLQYDNQSRPIISYYAKTPGDLRFAAFYNGNWSLSTIDSVGDVGRYSSLALNPATGRWAMAYEDTGHGSFKYADQGKSAWTLTNVDRSTQSGGGYISLAFNPKTKLPAFSYYDAHNADLKYAAFNGSAWSTQTVAAHNSQGLYTNLSFNASGVADILYDNKSNDSVFRATQSGKVWSVTQITTDGGHWISRAVSSSKQTFAYLKGTTITLKDL